MNLLLFIIIPWLILYQKTWKAQNRGDINPKEAIGMNELKDIALPFIRICIFTSIFFRMYCDVSNTSLSVLTLNLQVRDYVKIISLYGFLLFMISDGRKTRKDIILSICKGITVVILLVIIKQNYNNHNIFQSSVVIYQDVVLIIFLLAISWIYPEKIEKVVKRFQGVQYIFGIISPLVVMFIIEYIVNPSLKDMKTYFLGANLLLYGVALYILATLIGNMKVSLYLYYSLALLLGLADYFVFMFRGKPLVPADFYSLGTAY